MTDEQRQELMRRQAEGMRAVSSEEMARRQQDAAAGAYNVGVSRDSYAGAQTAMNNFWREAADAMPIAQLPPKPRPTLWARFKRWLRA